MSILVSVIIPARNEAALLARTIESVLAAASVLQAEQDGCGVEVIVVDNDSTDGTAAVAEEYRSDARVTLLLCTQLGSALARNAGARQSLGGVLVFLDADTLMPATALQQIVAHCTSGRYLAGMTGLASAETGRRAQCWWWFWNQVRRLPLPRAKGMPALMFCTRAAFTQFGPFDEDVSIGEEWPILAGVYRADRQRFIYDRTIIARSSSRRMELQRFGYLRTFGRYVWAVLHRSGRIAYPDTVRHQHTTCQESDHADRALCHPFSHCLRRGPTAATSRRDGSSASLSRDGG